MATPTTNKIQGVMFHSAIPGNPVNCVSVGIERPTVQNRHIKTPAMEQVAQGVVLTWPAMGSVPVKKVLVPFSNIAAILYVNEE